MKRTIESRPCTIDRSIYVCDGCGVEIGSFPLYFTCDICNADVCSECRLVVVGVGDDDHGFTVICKSHAPQLATMKEYERAASALHSAESEARVALDALLQEIREARERHNP